LRFAPKVVRDFVKDLPKSAVPVVFSVLGALTYQSATTIANFFLEEGQMRQQKDYEAERDIRVLGNTVLVMESSTHLLDFKQHMQLLIDFENSLPRITSEEREHFAAQIREAINESNKNVGTFEGYSGVETTLPQNWFVSVTQLSTSELQLLETARGCVARPLVTRASKERCNVSLGHQFPLFWRASSRDKSAEEAAKIARSMWDRERDVRWSKARHGVDMLFVRALGAMVGLSMCFWAYSKLISYFIESERREGHQGA
jgi:hypothetical protein